MRWPWLLIAAFCAARLVASPSHAAVETSSSLQAHFDSEPNSVRKAKLFEKLGNAQMQDARKAQEANDFNSVGLIWEKFRNNVRDALDALQKQHPDAEKQSNGYRQLEVTTRLGIRELDQTVLEAPEPYKPPLTLVRRDLSSMDEQMLKLLFPRRIQDPPSATNPTEKPQ